MSVRTRVHRDRRGCARAHVFHSARRRPKGRGTAAAKHAWQRVVAFKCHLHGPASWEDWLTPGREQRNDESGAPGSSGTPEGRTRRKGEGVMGVRGRCKSTREPTQRHPSVRRRRQGSWAGRRDEAGTMTKCNTGGPLGEVLGQTMAIR